MVAISAVCYIGGKTHCCFGGWKCYKLITLLELSQRLKLNQKLNLECSTK